LLPLDVILVGNLLFVKGMAFKFVEACVASLAYSLIFILVMLTSDLNLRKRVLIILTGWLLIFVMNVMRIIVLVSVAVNHSEELFKSLDIVIWLGISGVFVALVWIALVWLYDIKSIPVYNDIKFLMKNSYFSK
jgi:exosortase/archaeosortase family protein